MEKLQGIISIELVVSYGLKLIGAILILIIGFWVAKKLSRGFRKILEKRAIDKSLTSFLASFVSVLLRIIIIIIAISSVGIEMTSIAAILGAASLAVGMALSGTFQNFAGGMIILFLKPFKVGDVIEAQGFTGTVDAVAMFTTLIKTPDNKTIFVPNGALANGSIINYTRAGVRRLDMTIGISYGNDVQKARKVLLSMITADARVHTSPEPVIVLTALADSSVNITARMWTDSANYFAVQGDLIEKIYNTFPGEGLNFPFPQVQVHTK